MKKLILIFLLLSICLIGETQSSNITSLKESKNLKMSDIKRMLPVKGIDSTDIPEKEKDWATGTGGLFTDEGYGVASDKVGDIYVTGRFSKSIVFGSDRT